MGMRDPETGQSNYQDPPTTLCNHWIFNDQPSGTAWHDIWSVTNGDSSTVEAGMKCLLIQKSRLEVR